MTRIYNQYEYNGLKLNQKRNVSEFVWIKHINGLWKFFGKAKWQETVSEIVIVNRCLPLVTYRRVWRATKWL